jgi:hypothetical protein
MPWIDKIKCVSVKLAGGVWSRMLVILGRYCTTNAESSFLRSTRLATGQSKEEASVVLVEAVEDHYYLALFADVAARLAAERPISVRQVVSRSLRPGASRSIYHALKSVFFYNAFTDRKWIRLYAAFCSAVAYKSADGSISRKSLLDAIEARRISRNIRSKEMLLDLTLSGVKVGDLVYDTYLRFKPAATVDLNSGYLMVVIWQTLRELRAAQACMSRLKPAMFLTTYSTYVQHGIAVRVALAAGVKVFSFGNFQEFYKKLHLDDWAHTRNPDDYRSGFLRLSNGPSKIELADKALAARLSGKVDAATAYMRRSAYEGESSIPEGIAGSIVLFLHDFFDSPHCYRWMLFPDFWEWATYTLDIATQAGISVYVKPHPNQVAGNEPIIQKLMMKYPDVKWLSVNTSNSQLAGAGMACAVTIYGTVAHEMAYLGVPTIAAGHNPHIDFSFCHTARTREEYRRLLLGHRNLPRATTDLRRGSLEFYCMHNLAVSGDEASLRETVLRFRMLVIRSGWLRDGREFMEFSKALRAEPAFHEACMQLALELACNPGSELSRGTRDEPKKVAIR